MSAVTFDRVRGQMLGEHQARGLGAGLHGSWRAAIGERRERDARTWALCGRSAVADKDLSRPGKLTRPI